MCVPEFLSPTVDRHTDRQAQRVRWGLLFEFDLLKKRALRIHRPVMLLRRRMVAELSVYLREVDPSVRLAEKMDRNGGWQMLRQWFL